MQLQLEDLTDYSLNYVWDNMREYDKIELEIQQYNIEEAQNLVDGLYAYALHEPVDGYPVAVGGAVEWPQAVIGSMRLMIWGFGTDQANRYMIDIHKHAKTFLSYLDDVEWQRLQSVLVWDDHTTSLKWLRSLGFQDTEYSYLGLNNQRILLLERPGVCVDQRQSQ